MARALIQSRWKASVSPSMWEAPLAITLAAPQRTTAITAAAVPAAERSLMSR